MTTKAENLARCDELLATAEKLERDLHLLASSLPPGTANTARFLTETARAAHVTVSRLHNAYNAIRRYDHG